MDAKLYWFNRISPSNVKTIRAKGVLVSGLTVGERIVFHRNGIMQGKSMGIKTVIKTNPVLRIEGNQYFTENSIYVLEEVN